MTLINQ